jgi:hypothetical protein
LRFVILHYHILKNAGSTVEEALDHSFGERFARLDSDQRDHTIDAGGLLDFVRANPAIEAVASHQIRYPMPEARGILFFDICFVRDPIERVWSMYDYFRKRPADGDPVSELANRSEPGEFVAGMVKDFALQVRNVQVNLIAAAGDSDEPTEADLDVATKRMMEASFPGVVDIFDKSVAAGLYRLRTVFPRLEFVREAENVSRGPDAPKRPNLRDVCDHDVWDELMRISELDFELVRRVRAEVERRFTIASQVSAGVSGPALDPREVFDAAYYLAANPDVRAARIQPLKHYLAHGMQEGRKPHPLFQPAYYAAHGCNPHRLFDCAGYVAAHPEVAGSGLHPLVHFIKSGKAVSRSGSGVEIDGVELDLSSPPQQRRFLESVSYSQLQAQTGGE